MTLPPVGTSNNTTNPQYDTTMKTKQNRSAFSNLRVLIGLLAVGVVLAAFARHAGGRPSGSNLARQRLPLTPWGSTEAWVRRIDGPVHGNDHAHDVATDPAGNVLVTGWIETASGNEDCHTVKYSSDGDVIWEDTYAGSA